jgi:serine/threonine protein kinase/tetratricopeptide (TPR) repeat protein
MVAGYMIGRIISHYRIIEKLGAGGMGMVFRARDELLERDVAIKFLPPGLITEDAARKRFLTEALALARLHHPNIGTIFEFGSDDGNDYLVMECVTGVTLAERLASGSLPEKEAIAVGTQIAEALEEAHEHGVIHCDLKPSNIMITPKGRVKILDFGVARLARRVADEVSATTATFEDTGRMTGTLPYMAPEQLFGEFTDARTDIHAFGAVLFEIVTGHRAFPQEIVPRISEAILHRAPAVPSSLSPGLSPEIERIILKCLEKSPEDRYQSAKELCIDLRRLAAPTAPITPVAQPPSLMRRGAEISVALLLVLFVIALVVPGLRQRSLLFLGIDGRPAIQSLAVLPVEDLSKNATQAYFADGLTDAMTYELAEISQWKVISAESMMQYKDQGLPLRRIGRELNVDALVVASVKRSGDTVRLMVKLFRPSDNTQLWSHEYDCRVEDIPAVSNEIVEAVARRTHVSLSPEERLHLSQHPDVTPAAEDAYLQGVSCLEIRTEASLAKARGAFEQAIAADNDFAPAYSGLAAASTLCDCHDRERPALMEKAKQAALHALELNEGLAQAHAALGYIQMFYGYDWPSAQRELKRAIALSPSLADGHRFYGEYLVQTGHPQEGVGELRKAVALDPLSVPMNAALGIALYNVHDYEAAIDQFQTTLVMDPGSGLALTGLGFALLQTGNYMQAAAQFQKAIAGGYEVTRSTAHLAQAYALMGGRAEAWQTIGEISGLHGANEPSAYTLALVYTALGDHSNALDWLDKAYEAREPAIAYLKVDPSLDPLRDDPRFQSLVHRVGIP